MFFERSPRWVVPQRAAALATAPGPARVGLFVEPSEREVLDTLKLVDLDVLQIVGTPERAASVRRYSGLPVWHVAPIAAAADLPATLAGADALLLDAKPPPGATRPGGNAAAFDWSLLRGWEAPGPWLLAGGLTPATVAAAIAETGAPGVDVSSGVESAPGVKNPALIDAFITAARSARGPSPRPYPEGEGGPCGG